MIKKLHNHILKGSHKSTSAYYLRLNNSIIQLIKQLY